MRGALLAGEDAAWLRMDSATNPMVVNAIVELDEKIDPEAARSLAERIGSLPRFGSRIRSPFGLGPPRWEQVAGFRPGDHVERIDLEAANGAGLRDQIGLLVSAPLDVRRPLWRMVVIDRDGAGTMLLFRVHHALADGFALLGVLASLCDGERGAFRVAPRRARGLRAGAIRGSLRALGHLVASPSDPPTVLKHALGTDKRVAWSDPIALDEIKRIARSSSATVNDVLVALVTGALSRHLARRGDSVDGREIHAMVPVNLRRDLDRPSVGNDFGLVILGLPIGIADPLARIDAVKMRMEAIKATPEAGVAHGLLRVVGLAPKRVEDAAVSFFGKKTSLVLTNVPGPQRKVSLGGIGVRRIVFWVPQASRMGLGISIFSYAREITVGILSDSAVVKEPEGLLADLRAELASLEGCSGGPRQT